MWRPEIGNPKVWPTNLLTDQLTWVGARDTCVSKKTCCMLLSSLDWCWCCDSLPCPTSSAHWHSWTNHKLCVHPPHTFKPRTLNMTLLLHVKQCLTIFVNFYIFLKMLTIFVNFDSFVLTSFLLLFTMLRFFLKKNFLRILIILTIVDNFGQFWHLCYLTIKSDTGQLLQFLRCLVIIWIIWDLSGDDHPVTEIKGRLQRIILSIAAKLKSAKI